MRCSSVLPGVGQHGFEQKQDDDEQDDWKIHPVGSGEECGVVELFEEGSPGGERLGDAEAEGAEVGLGDEEGGDADEELREQERLQVGENVQADRAGWG